MKYAIKRETVPRCLECGDVLKYGRSDRKFCSVKCRTAYNNRKARAGRRVRLKVRNAIERNYSILEKLLKAKVQSIALPEIRILGFRTEYATSYRKANGHHEFWCFDIKYYLTENRLFSISRMTLPPDIAEIH